MTQCPFSGVLPLLLLRPCSPLSSTNTHCHAPWKGWPIWCSQAGSEDSQRQRGRNFLCLFPVSYLVAQCDKEPGVCWPCKEVKRGHFRSERQGSRIWGSQGKGDLAGWARLRQQSRGHSFSDILFMSVSLQWTKAPTDHTMVSHSFGTLPVMNSWSYSVCATIRKCLRLGDLERLEIYFS
jgi:hypothetical protein